MWRVPEISRFFGIVIAMYYNDHYPAHFHAEYGEFYADVEIESGRVIGAFPRRKQAVVLAWLDVHRRELLDNWERARLGLPLHRIPPAE